MFENISLDGLIIMGEVTIVALAILNIFTAVMLYKAYKTPVIVFRPVEGSGEKRKSGRPKKK